MAMKVLPFLALMALSPLVLSGQTWLEDLQAYRQERLQGLLSDPRQPVDSASAAGIRWFNPDERYRIRCRVSRLQDTERMVIPTYSGMQKTFRPVAQLHFDLHGQAQTLTVFHYVMPPAMSGAATPYFLPFKDATNGDQSYGGGRYLDIPSDALQGDTFLLDLNRAYNPLCAYGDGFHCPIPPRENHLQCMVEAGEKAFDGACKHKD